MKILMLTNTFTPHVGGVALSVQRYTDEFRRQGHDVLVAAPAYKGNPRNELDVVRFPALQHFNGTEFSVPMPVPGRLALALRAFQPDIVHSHHPCLLGATAVRVATVRNLPLVYTHHTNYENYTHYIPGDSPHLQRFVVDVLTGYCNLCDAVIAPSGTVADLVRKRGVVTPTAVIPTGLQTAFFDSGDGEAFRRRADIPLDALVVGHVGRLAPEKNLEFLTAALIRYLERHPRAYYLLIGLGPSRELMKVAFAARGLLNRIRFAGLLQGSELAAAYKAMDVFVFASHTETQGMVLTEAMAAGVPVVAVNASGVREVVCDGDNGRLLPGDDVATFASALSWITSLPPPGKRRLADAARRTARQFDISLTAVQTLALYESMISRARTRCKSSSWSAVRKRLSGEWKLISNMARAAGESFRGERARDLHLMDIKKDSTETGN